MFARAGVDLVALDDGLVPAVRKKTSKLIFAWHLEDQLLELNPKGLGQRAVCGETGIANPLPVSTNGM